MEVTAEADILTVLGQVQCWSTLAHYHMQNWAGPSLLTARQVMVNGKHFELCMVSISTMLHSKIVVQRVLQVTV